MPRLLARLLLVVGAVVLLAGCRADVTVSIAADDDGSGLVEVQVVLDAEAVDRLDDLESFQTDDLTDAGWTVTDPVDLEDGGVRLRASKPYPVPPAPGSAAPGTGGPTSRAPRRGAERERS
jgi:hypothetical protein